VPTQEITIPKAYMIPQGWHNIIELLVLNNIEMQQLKNDSLFAVESYKIKNYKTKTNPYEGHYSHYGTNVETTIQNINFHKGDYIVNTNQEGLRYLLETLEPEATDSFFNWNFFDTILQQKEGFSPYVFEDTAIQLLKQNSVLKTAFEIKKNSDKAFASNWYAQLNWIFKRSNHYENAHMQYPVYRIK
jgi:hypothetical protein